jgi:hypothetical protein
MPEISRFFGITIQMYFGDHPAPHFHATYGGQTAKIQICPFEKRGQPFIIDIYRAREKQSASFLDFLEPQIFFGKGKEKSRLLILKPCV